MVRVLLIEDNPDLRKVYRKFMEVADFDVTESTNGEEALELLRTETFDLAVSDMMLPCCTGTEILQKVRNDPAMADMPFVIISARNSDEMEIEAFNEGVDDFLHKPIKCELLIARIKRIVKRHQNRPEITVDTASEEFSGAFYGFDVFERIGSGTYGEVFRAQQNSLRREVAIKALRPQYLEDTDIIGRFKAEGRAMCLVHHCGVLTVHALREQEGRPFLVMEYLPGDSLATRISKDEKFSVEQIIQFASKIANILQYLHSVGVVHRDIKPQNILFKDGDNPVLTDFGVALLEEGARWTHEGNVVGTLAYMAPEQLEEQEVDGRSDLYSLGVVLYEMFSGHHPFDATTPQGLAARILTEPAAPLENSGILAPIVSKLLEKNMNDRYASAEELAEALRSLEKCNC